MCDPARVHVELDMVPGPEPITGSITRPDGTRAQFVGWLELSSALEALRDGGLARTGDRGSG